MKAILINQAQFKKEVQKVMHEFTDKARKAKTERGEEYSAREEMSDVLEMSIIFALLETNLFNKRGESREQ